MARKKKITRNELEELDEAYIHLTGRTPGKNRSFSGVFSLLLILLLLGGISLAVYWLLNM